MPRPTQENDITSSLNDLEIVLSDSDDDQENEQELNVTIDKTFPWLQNVNRMLNNAIKNFGSCRTLNKLLEVYTRNATRDLFGNNKTKNLDILKQHLSNTLLFVHYYCHQVEKNEIEQTRYLIKMADLLAVFIELHIRTSTKEIKSIDVSAKLLNYLNIFLDKSNDHIARTLLQSRCRTQMHYDILVPLFRKCFLSAQIELDIISDETYLRYLLLLLCWREGIKDPVKKSELALLGVKKLGETVPWSNSEFSQLICKPPTRWLKGETTWLMQPYCFDLQKTCSSFLIYEAKIRGIIIN